LNGVVLPVRMVDTCKRMLALKVHAHECKGIRFRLNFGIQYLDSSASLIVWFV